MKREILAWLLFITCCNVLSYYACESVVAAENKPLIRAKQLKNVHESINGSKRTSDQRTLEGMLQEIHVKTFQRAGKGVYGGANNLRPASKGKSGANPLLLKSSSFLSTILRHVATGLLVFVAFF